MLIDGHLLTELSERMYGEGICPNAKRLPPFKLELESAEACIGASHGFVRKFSRTLTNLSFDEAKDTVRGSILMLIAILWTSTGT